VDRIDDSTKWSRTYQCHDCLLHWRFYEEDVEVVVPKEPGLWGDDPKYFFVTCPECGTRINIGGSLRYIWRHDMAVKALRRKQDERQEADGRDD
jgi:hypothetical protein